MPAETKAFDVPTLVSLVSGTLLTPSFSKVHEAAEFVMGHQIWTHEFASKELWGRLRAKVFEQHPDLDVETKGVNKENWQAFSADLVSLLGETREIVKGNESRDADPITTARTILSPDKPIIAVQHQRTEPKGRAK